MHHSWQKSWAKPIWGGALGLLLAAEAIRAEEKLIDRTVALVNGRLLTLSELEFETQVAWIQFGKVHPSQLQAGLPPDSLHEALNYAIGVRLESEEAERLAVYPMSEAESIQAIEDLKAKFHDSNAFQAFLTKHDVGVEQLAVVLARALQAAKVLDAKIRFRAQVTEKDVRTYYEAHRGASGLPYEKVREALREKLMADKMKSLAEEELSKIRHSGNVRILAPLDKSHVGHSSKP